MFLCRTNTTAGRAGSSMGSMEITIVDHPLAASRLTLMRDHRSDNTAFRAALADLGTMLVYEASRNLPVEHFECQTPVALAEGTRLENPPIIVPVIRAGLGMVDPALSMIPDAQVGFIGLARNEVTHEPVPYLEALPHDLTGRTVFVVDPMLATGGSLLHAIRLLAERGATDITAICMVSAQPGVDALANSGLPCRLVTACVDPELNADAYIVPGLGDAGDRLYGPRNIDL
ncbi:Uracil phosphoribosyltransferase [Corynebacterium comes]|uniref:Uracil phosphoribosyltransferase n=2 Tax=Corynebacterium comes TaxID=2675218 RepID=A0A6B8VLD0_9CORY|nr:Uracil phosphoribosyltransferase [Corynebacterium comes]